MTIDPKYIDLMNADIDGEISADDRVKLEDYLAGHPEARAYRDELAALCAELDNVEFIEPPAELKRAVLDAVTRQSAARPGSMTIDWRLGLRALFGSAAARYAMSFAAGAILAYTVISSDQIYRHAFDDVTDLVGTISQPGATAMQSNEYQIRLGLSEIAGSVNLDRAGSILILNFDLVSRAPIEIVADIDDPDIWFTGFAQLESEGTSIAAETGRVTVRMTGQRRYAVYLYNTSQAAATISLRFYSGGTLIHEDELIFGDTN